MNLPGSWLSSRRTAPLSPGRLCPSHSAAACQAATNAALFSCFTFHSPSLNCCPIFSTFHLQISYSIGIIIVCPTACVTGSCPDRVRSARAQSIESVSCWTDLRHSGGMLNRLKPVANLSGTPNSRLLAIIHQFGQ
jgi:hypothetical protein